MKKVISAMLILLILLNFTLCNNAYATGRGSDDPQTNSAYFGNATPSNGVAAELVDEGTVSTTQGSASKTETSSNSYGASIIGVVTGILARILNVPFTVADATTLTEAGYVGEDVENILLRLIQAADFDIERAVVEAEILKPKYLEY